MLQISNNLECQLTVFTLKGTASQGGTVYATFNNNLTTPLIAETKSQSGQSAAVPATLTQGSAGSLSLVTNSAAGLDIVSSRVVFGFFFNDWR